MNNNPHLWFASMPEGVTYFSRQVHSLFLLSFYICLGIFIFVSFFVILFMIRYRQSHNPNAQPVKEPLLIEVIWVVIPFLLLIIMAVPATGLIIQFNKTTKADMSILVTGYQWKWQYHYLEDNLEFFSNLATPLAQTQGIAPKNRWYLREVDRPLVVPIHKKIRFLVTSHDVIHSWWVPDLGLKRDALPGYIYEFSATIDQAGVYRGQCAELCGIHHGFMPIVIEAKTPQDFAVWLAQQKNTTAPKEIETKKDFNTLMAEGKQIYNLQCGACHGINGKGFPPAISAMAGSRVAIGPLPRHIDIVLNGQPLTAMPAFGEQLTDAQIAAVITYERNSWGNNDQLKYGFQAGGIVQTKDIADIRKRLW